MSNLFDNPLEGATEFSVEYPNGGFLKVVPGIEACIRYNTGDWIYFIFSDGKYVVSRIETNDHLKFDYHPER
jgi:hypothetical protein